MAIVKRISDLDSITIENNSKKAIVLVHGYGASFEDLYPLHSYIKDHKNFDWYFPNGHLEIPMGYISGRAWFPIDMQALTQAQMSGTHRDFKNINPEGFELALDKLDSFIKALDSYEELIIGGFSQGAMLLSHLIFKNYTNLKAALLLSGVLVNNNLFQSYPNKELKVFQSHGKQDEILSFLGAVDLKNELMNKGCKSEFHEFNGGHEIPLNIIQKMSDFVS